MAHPRSVTPQLYRSCRRAERRATGHPVPVSLSPSSMSTFTSCPLSFRFSYIERLPEPPSAPASKGTLVHLALQHLMWRPPAERTIEAALADLDRATRRARRPSRVRRARAHRRGVGRSSTADAEVLVRRYFEMEDPTARAPCSASSCASAPRPPTASSIRGIIDRLELDADGELVVTDYKTGRARRARAGSSRAWPASTSTRCCASGCSAASRPSAAAVPLEAGTHRHRTERPVAARRRGEVGRGDEGRAHRVCPRRLPPADVGAVLVLLVPGVLPRVRRRSRAGRARCWRAKPSAKAGRSCRSSFV